MRLTFSTGHVQSFWAQKIEYENNCGALDCSHTFITENPLQVYCDAECQKRAKYQRWKGRPTSGG